ncbi:hypothetical protein L1285_21520 [Pseudoalteromonas sp. DL2-H2.2]|uniref:hypothetical protein n=1 Tax=Pseudoalteromonas sp. DL2-H2.2 TaxID=2908889 RepID=UPI001F2501A7|nr:hypothetical protein [Pseudoalteromonas sp. DL2-H2.2]MCF2910889.1 hypothetical protein [Pseudoalteromonas sp. DL2-H2.2]
MKILNVRALMATVSLFCGNVVAAAIYPIGSSCTLDDVRPAMKLQAELKQRKGQQLHDIIDLLKADLFDELQSKLSGYPNGVEIDSLTFDYDEVSGSALYHTIVEAKLTAHAVKTCASNNRITRAADLNVQPVNQHQQSSVTEYAINIDIVREVKQQHLPTNVITPSSVFGIHLGTRFADAERLIGRFSLLWQLDAKTRLATIGRNHALFFVDDQFVGYQYANFLFPTVINNLVEFQSLDMMLTVGENSLTVSNGLMMDDSQSEFIRKAFSVNQTVKVRLADEGSEATKLEHLEIGKLPSLANGVSSLPCLTTAQSTSVKEKDLTGMIELVSVQGEQVYMSGCSEVITLEKGGRVKQLDLLEPIRIRNAQLWQATRLFDFQPWQFRHLAYHTALSDLDITDEELVDDVLEIEQQSWFGHFFVEQSKVVAGTVYFSL